MRTAQASCGKCPLRRGCDAVSPSGGEVSARLMVVWDVPPGEDATRMLAKLLRSAEIERDSVFVTHMVRCTPPPGRQPRAAELAACKGWLWREILLVRPRVIVTLGVTPAKVLLRGNSRFIFEEVVGRPHRPGYIPGAAVVPIRHPSRLLGGRIERVRETVTVLRKCRRLIES